MYQLQNSNFLIVQHSVQLCFKTYVVVHVRLCIIDKCLFLFSVFLFVFFLPKLIAVSVY